MSFGVREGLVQKRYTQVQKTIESIAPQYQMKYKLTMDDSFLYIVLYKQNHSFIQILPLEQPAYQMNQKMSGVKVND
ncbi:hypothetical protein [Thermoflavimicrobium daqui]|uniref:Uncharacterized protein n=1 Tax=Thermoflavimicrobium daqui TaxID=2137476 RepID=A0A364K0H5_9BACL|nr:hypothetical protein [Thermoflavimicrobium daqui]RAL20842.1 hypothetical protein DL897_17565 [Thermoflavimicrobium daqui]